MKKKIIMNILAILFTFCFVPNYVKAYDKSIDINKEIQQMERDYNVTIEYDMSDNIDSISTEDIVSELNDIEHRIEVGYLRKIENNKKAAMESTKRSSRVLEAATTNEFNILGNQLQATTTVPNYTVYYYQQIGSLYPNATTIRCRYTGTRVFSNKNNRYLWGSTVSTKSSLYAGAGSKWTETKCTTSKIDGGRTENVQVWGDLQEKYNGLTGEYTVYSNGWRIWYEAYCPAKL